MGNEPSRAEKRLLEATYVDNYTYHDAPTEDSIVMGQISNDPHLEEDLEFAEAYRKAQNSLPEGQGGFIRLSGPLTDDLTEVRFSVRAAWSPGNDQPGGDLTASGETATLALNNLIKELRGG